MGPQWPQNLIAVGDTTWCNKLSCVLSPATDNSFLNKYPLPPTLHPILFLLQDPTGEGEPWSQSIPMTILSLIPLLRDLLALSHVTVCSQMQNLPAPAAGRMTVEPQPHRNRQ